MTSPKQTTADLRAKPWEIFEKGHEATEDFVRDLIADLEAAEAELGEAKALLREARKNARESACSHAHNAAPSGAGSESCIETENCTTYCPRCRTLAELSEALS